MKNKNVKEQDVDEFFHYIKNGETIAQTKEKQIKRRKFIQKIILTNTIYGAFGNNSLSIKDIDKLIKCVNEVDVEYINVE